jgi:hypothetical protein
LINNLAVAQAYIKFKTAISSMDPSMRKKQFEHYSKQNYVVPSLQKILLKGYEHLQ